MHSLASPMEGNSGAYNRFKSLESQSHCCYVVQKTVCRRCSRHVFSLYDGRAKTVGGPVRSVPMSEANTLRPSNSSYFVRRATANLRSPRYRHGVSRVVDHFANGSRVAYSLVTLVSRNSNFLSSFKGSFKAGVHIGRVSRQLVYDCYDSPQKSQNESRRVTRPGNPER